jgi:hypothetical protein
MFSLWQVQAFKTFYIRFFSNPDNWKLVYHMCSNLKVNRTDVFYILGIVFTFWFGNKFYEYLG